MDFLNGSFNHNLDEHGFRQVHQVNSFLFNLGGGTLFLCSETAQFVWSLLFWSLIEDAADGSEI
jgi:hypothetical protein